MLIACNICASQVIIDSDSFQKVYLSSKSQISKDVHTPADLLSDEKFQNHTDFSFNIGQHRSSFWIKFNVQNTSPYKRNLYLELTNPNINQGRLYVLRDSQVSLLYDFGVKYPFFQRPVSHSNFLLPITIDSLENATYYVEILPGMLSNYFNLILWDKRARDDYKHYELLFICLFQTIHFIFLGVLGTVMYITRQKWQWTLFVYSFLSVLYKYIDLGLAYRFVWPNSPAIQQIGSFIITNILTIAAIFFLRRYLNTKINAPLLDRVYIFFARLLIILIGIRVLNLFLELPILSTLQYFNAGIILTVISVAVFNLSSFIKNKVERSACISFIVCFGPLIVVYILFCLKLLGVYHISLMSFSDSPIFLTSLDSENLFVWAVYWEIFFVSLLMIFRLNYLFKDNQKVYEILAMERKESVTRLINSIESERRRVAQELHDGSGVSLSAIRMKMTHLKDSLTEGENSALLNNIMKDIDILSKEIREISHFIMPISLSKLGLKAGINELIGKLNYSNRETEFNVFQQYDENRLTAEQQTNIYRICQELLNNAIKHASASQVNLNLVDDDGYLSISMEDNGVGFDVNKESKGLGINNIRLRTELMQGTFEMESNSESSGSFFNINIPIK